MNYRIFFKERWHLKFRCFTLLELTSSVLILRIYFSVSPSVMAVVRFYSSEVVNGRALQRAARLYPQLSIASELCYNVELTGECETACQMKMQEVVDSEEIVTTERHINSPCEDFPTHLLFFFFFFSLLHIVIVSFRSLLQAARVSAQSRRRFSSGCFGLLCRQSRCLRNQTSQRAARRNWWRSDRGNECTHTVW